MMLTGQIGLRRNGGTLITRAIEWATRSTSHHAVLAISDEYCVSAEPGGVVIQPISQYPSLDWSRFDLTPEQRANIVIIATAKQGLPYNFWIYPILFVVNVFGLNCPDWVATWLQKRRAVDCSQCVDDVYSEAGIELLPANNVLTTPGDLERIYRQHGWL